MGEAGVREQTAGRGNLLLGDQDAARQDSQRSFEHAHVLVEDQVPNVGSLQERLDGGKENSIVGANEFAHARLPLGKPRLPTRIRSRLPA